MPNSRKRKGHHHHSDQQNYRGTKQKSSGHLLWSVLLAIFAVLAGLLATGLNIPVLVICALAGAGIGYAIGRSMEKNLK